LELSNSFSYWTMHNEVFGSRVKPWEDKELDFFAGLHFMSFMFTTICMTSMGFSIGWYMDLL
jgi:hypothetical protein